MWNWIEWYAHLFCWVKFHIFSFWNMFYCWTCDAKKTLIGLDSKVFWFASTQPRKKRWKEFCKFFGFSAVICLDWKADPANLLAFWMYICIANPHSLLPVLQKCSYKLYYSVTRSSMSAQISFQGKSQKIIFTNNFIVAHKNKISQLL